MIYLAVTFLAALSLLLLVAIARRLPAPFPTRRSESGKPRIIILGGGFAGVYTADALEALQRDDFEYRPRQSVSFGRSRAGCP
jgi:hypothetical protein